MGGGSGGVENDVNDGEWKGSLLFETSFWNTYIRERDSGGSSSGVEDDGDNGECKRSGECCASGSHPLLYMEEYWALGLHERVKEMRAIYPQELNRFLSESLEVWYGVSVSWWIVRWDRGWGNSQQKQIYTLTGLGLDSHADWDMPNNIYENGDCEKLKYLVFCLGFTIGLLAGGILEGRIYIAKISESNNLSCKYLHLPRS